MIPYKNDLLTGLLGRYYEIRSPIFFVRPELVYQLPSNNERFTNWVTRSVLEIQSPQFYAWLSHARTVQKRSGFVFLSTDQVTRSANR